jgi:hypothetical protein
MSGGVRRAATDRTLLIPGVILLAVVADRLQISVSTGGNGALPLLDLIAPPAALLAIAAYGSQRSLRYLGSPVFLLGILPYLALSAVLPVLGVMFYGYPVRTLLAATGLTTALSLVTIGAALSDRNERAWAPWVFIAIVAQFTYGLAQAVYVARGPGWELFGPFHNWDLSLQALGGVLVQTRSSGLYFNPNELGLWAGMAALIGWSILPSRLRVLGVTLAVGTLLLSQSRGASVALVAALCVAVVVAFGQRSVSAERAMKALVSLGVVGGLVVFAVSVIGLPAVTLERFSSLLSVLSQGPQADANLAGRLDYWHAVITLNAFYPWGTWGPPELLLGTAIDSSWFQAFAQGSVPYAAALGVLFISTVMLVRSRCGPLLCVLAVFIAVAGLTQTPFGYPPIILFWVLLGSALQQSIAVPATLASSEPLPHWTTARRIRSDVEVRSQRLS